MTLSEYKGKPVVSMEGGEKVGTVKDVLVDTSNLTVTALVLGGDPGKGLLPLTAVKSVGRDAVTVDSANAIQWATGGNVANGREADEIVGLTVVDGNGSAIGSVHDFMIEDGGRIDLIDVHEGGVFGLGAKSIKVPAASVRSVGPKLVTVEVAPSTV